MRIVESVETRVHKLSLLPIFFWLPFAGLQAQVSDPIEATPQRPSFSNDTSTTVPGTIELEIGSTTSSDFFGLPAAIKFTPDVGERWLRGTEFSVGFDAISSLEMGNERTTQFGDRIGFAVRRALYRDEAFSFAVVPQALFFLRGEQGARLGVAALAVYQFGLNSLVGNLVWSAATHASDSNPSRQHALIGGYSRTLGTGELSKRFSIFAEYLHEFPSGGRDAVSLLQGVSYRWTPGLVLDFAVQHTGLAAGPSDVQLLAGLTVNLGRVSAWRLKKQ